MAAQLTMAARVPCACSSSSSSPRLGAAQRAAARHRPATALLRQRAAGGLRAASRRQLGCVRAVLDVGDADFEQEVLKSELPVLVDFWATWCGPCKLVAPSMVWAEKEYAGRLKVVKVEADPNPAIIEQYKVYGLPCLIVFKDGKAIEESHHEGAVTKKALVEYLAKHGVPATANA